MPLLNSRKYVSICITHKRIGRGDKWQKFWVQVSR
jgi:hypothetical protein